MKPLEKHFEKFRKNIIGIDAQFDTPYGKKKLIYADWIAGGRLYLPIEQQMTKVFGPFVANTHTETNDSGTKMTFSYQLAHNKIKEHVNAGTNDVIITAGFGMTAVVNKLQRILGLKACDKYSDIRCPKREEKPVVFITHMEHHSNQTSWLETIAEVVQIKHTDDLLVDLADLEEQLINYKERKLKIGTFTACSNVTGIITPYYKMAALMHKHGGLCFIDFAASAPYVDIDMHPDNPMEKLDAIFFSPHKFLGGPGSSGVVIFDKNLYHRKVPDNPGGGTVAWTNPWGEHKYIDDIEIREDGGTPGFLQAIRVALAIELKNQMGTNNIKAREGELVRKVFEEMKKVPNIKILADNIEERLGIISFYIENMHYNLLVKMLNDKYGIQVRGGCACAGTYGHYLLNVSHKYSQEITEKISRGDLSEKPGWVRLSLHPVMTDEEINFILKAIREIAENFEEWSDDYIYNKHTNEFFHKDVGQLDHSIIEDWFKFD